MIDAKYHRFVFAFFMALLMSCVMSLVVSIVNAGIGPGLLWRWLRSWSLAFCAGFPTVVTVAPIVQLLARSVIRVPREVA